MSDSKLLRDLKRYSVVPNEQMKSKLDYYYKPYNGFYNINKCMKFDDKHINPKITDHWEAIANAMFSRENAKFFCESVSTLHNYQRKRIRIPTE